MTKKRVIRAVHEYDLEEFLESAGLLEDARQGRLRCTLCGEAIGIGTIGKFVIKGSDIKVVCDRPGCSFLREESKDAA